MTGVVELLGADAAGDATAGDATAGDATTGLAVPEKAGVEEAEGEAERMGALISRDLGGMEGADA